MTATVSNFSKAIVSLPYETFKSFDATIGLTALVKSVLSELKRNNKLNPYHAPLIDGANEFLTALSLRKVYILATDVVADTYNWTTLGLSDARINLLKFTANVASLTSSFFTALSFLEKYAFVAAGRAKIFAYTIAKPVTSLVNLAAKPIIGEKRVKTYLDIAPSVKNVVSFFDIVGASASLGFNFKAAHSIHSSDLKARNGYANQKAQGDHFTAYSFAALDASKLLATSMTIASEYFADSKVRWINKAVKWAPAAIAYTGIIGGAQTFLVSAYKNAMYSTR